MKKSKKLERLGNSLFASSNIKLSKILGKGDADNVAETETWTDGGTDWYLDTMSLAPADQTCLPDGSNSSSTPKRIFGFKR